MPTDLTGFSGKRVLITGGATGIGREIARVFLRLGADVVICGRSKESLDDASIDLRDSGGDLTVISSDITQESSVEDLFEQIGSTRPVSVLVNCAGISRVTPTLELALADWDAVLSTNLTGAFLCSRFALPAMVAAGSGVIVNVGSIASHGGIVGRVAYCTSKHGLTGLTRALAVEFAAKGIRVVQVDPGYVETPLLNRFVEAGAVDKESLSVRTPMGRLAGADEVASVVVAAAGDGFRYVTGASIVVDGGWTAYVGSDPAWQGAMEVPDEEQ